MKSNWVAKASVVGEIKNFDSDNKATIHSFLSMFCGLVIIIRIHQQQEALAAQLDFTPEVFWLGF